MSLKRVESAARFHGSGWWVIPLQSSLRPFLVLGMSWGLVYQGLVGGGVYGSDLVSTHSQLIPLLFKPMGSWKRVTLYLLCLAGPWKAHRAQPLKVCHKTSPLISKRFSLIHSALEGISGCFLFWVCFSNSHAYLSLSFWVTVQRNPPVMGWIVSHS